LGLFFKKSKFVHTATPIERIFAECKIFNEFEKKDADRMLLLAKEFPGAVLVFATLRKSLTNGEKRLLQPVANRGRRYSKAERSYNPVLILTGNELFSDDNPRDIWTELGSSHIIHASAWGNDRELLPLADATQQIYLGMEPLHESVLRRQQAGRHAKNPKPLDSLTAGDTNPVENIPLTFPVAMRQVPSR
jgi:hypothetical protein